MSPLRKQMQDAMELRGMALRTQESYIGAVGDVPKSVEGSVGGGNDYATFFSCLEAGRSAWMSAPIWS